MCIQVLDGLGFCCIVISGFSNMFRRVQASRLFKIRSFDSDRPKKKSSLSTVVSESLTHSKKDFDVASLVRLLQRMVQKKMWLSTILNHIKPAETTAFNCQRNRDHPPLGLFLAASHGNIMGSFQKLGCDHWSYWVTGGMVHENGNPDFMGIEKTPWKWGLMSKFSMKWM